MHDYSGHTSLGLCFFSRKRVRTEKCCPTLQMLPTCTTLRTIDLNQWVSTFLMLQTFTTVPHVGWPQPWNYFRCCFMFHNCNFLLLWYAGCLICNPCERQLWLPMGSHPHSRQTLVSVIQHGLELFTEHTCVNNSNDISSTNKRLHLPILDQVENHQRT